LFLNTKTVRGNSFRKEVRKKGKGERRNNNLLFLKNRSCLKKKEPSSASPVPVVGRKV